MSDIVAQKVCIAGMGAIGTYLACRLSGTKVDLSVFARSGAADMIRADGLMLESTTGETITAQPKVLSPGSAEEPLDWIFVCVKSYSLPSLISEAAGLIRPATRVIFVQNGLAWWQVPQRENGETRLDPGAGIARTVALDRVVGCVAYCNVVNLGPGRARHLGDDTFILGQPDGELTAALEQLVHDFSGSGVDFRLTRHIQLEVWKKLWGSLAFNPISGLTGATLDRVVADNSTRPVVLAMMREAEEVVGRLGLRFDISVEERLQTASKAGAFKTSMLQDLEAGRPLEIDAILGAVSDLAASLGVATPTINTVLGLLTQKVEVLGAAGSAQESNTESR